ncbi:NAD(P)-dependent oxidoreductase [Mesobacillus foraminis]|uniref:NAD(P)-dependent oxidoreductase n=1 Tax=Mesobacillus foraminis TaxID=279826 RepID=UPI00288AD400|nr:NAD(P)H-binding protein [Mesobacillus foraminis]
MVRNPDKLHVTDENLTVIQGDVLNKDEIKCVLPKNDVMISALNTDGTTILSESMELIIEAMEKEGIKRIITVGTAAILQS